MITTNKELKAFLDRLPDNLRMSVETAEFVDKEIRRGMDLNHLQRAEVFDLLRWCAEQKVIPPAPLESFSAYTYQEWTDLAKIEEEWKPKLAALVRLLKSAPETAAKVSQTVQVILKEREVRRKEQAKLMEVIAAISDPVHDNVRANSKVSEAANIWLKRMQAARLGFGETPMPNLDLACTIADEAIDVHPGNPKVLFEAAGCHRLKAAAKDKNLSNLDRYVHIRQADTLFQKCYTILTAPPYSKLKGEYDKWRGGLSQIIIRVQQELKILEEKQK